MQDQSLTFYSQPSDYHQSGQRLPVFPDDVLSTKSPYQAAEHMALPSASEIFLCVNRTDVDALARRVRIQPRRQDRRRLKHLGTWRTICAKAARTSPPVRRAERPTTHHLDLNPETNDPDGALPSERDRLEEAGVESARRARVGCL